jgi:hypothetical protein
MKLKRIISVYSNANDSLLKEFDVSHVPLGNLRATVRPNSDDPGLLRPHRVERVQLMELNEFVPGLIDVTSKMENVEFFYECFE